MFKLTAYLLAFSIGFMIIEPNVASTYVAFNIETSSCCTSDEESCCSTESEDKNEKAPDGCCNKDACCNSGACYCCFLGNTQEPYNLKTYFTSHKITTSEVFNKTSDFSYTCFQPPEVV